MYDFCEATPAKPGTLRSGELGSGQDLPGQPGGVLAPLVHTLSRAGSARDLERRRRADGAQPEWPVVPPRPQRPARVRGAARLDGVVGISSANSAIPAARAPVSTELTEDAMGVVYWKGVRVDHFSEVSSRRSRLRSLSLAQSCRDLEAKGFPVNCRTVHDARFSQAPANTPWLGLMLGLQAVAHERDGTTWLVLQPCNQTAVVLGGLPGECQPSQVFCGSDRESANAIALQVLKGRGATFSGQWAHSYAEMLLVVERAGISVGDVAEALAQGR